VGDFLLTVGNIEPRKNQLGLIRAARQTGTRLVVLGRARDEAYAAACRAEAGSDVNFPGALAHDDPLLRSAYAACAAFCLPSTLETPGLAALEAAAAGARLVITREGSTCEYFGDDAVYVDPASVDDIAGGIETALGQAPGSALRERIASQFTWDRVVGPLATLYEGLAHRA
jgi:glycosyltransferase involved in cell wall biosynthesis